MYFPAEHLLEKLQITAEELSTFEQKGIVQGIAKAGRVFYSSRDMYRLKGIRLFMSRGLSLEEAKRRVDQPTEAVATQTRRLGRLLPEERVAELITIALRNCADHKLDIRMDGNAPQVIREEAARMFPSSGSRNPTLDSSDGQSDGSQERDASSSFGAQEARGRQTDGAVDFCEAATDLHGSVGSVVSSPDPHRDLLGIQREQSMKNSNGADRMRDGQLRAFAENLCTLAI